jgi:WD40 repeat protein
VIGLDDGIVDLLQLNETGYEDIVCDKIHNSRVTGLGYDSLTNVVFSISQDKIFRISHGTSLALVLGVPHKEQLLSLYKDNINKRIFIGSKIGEIFIYDISQVTICTFRQKNLSC